MNVVVFSPFGIGFPHLEMALEAVQEHLDAGDRVVWIGCTTEMLSCEWNPDHLASRCDKCVKRTRHGETLLAPRVSMQSFYPYLTDDNKREAQGLDTRVRTTEDLVRMRVDNFDIGEAALSSYATMAMRPELDVALHGEWLDRFLRSTLLVYRAMQNYLERHPTDLVHISNGRTGTTRAALRACESRGVRYVVRDSGCDPNHYAEYDNATAHDLDYGTREMLRIWQEAGGNPERDKVACRFYEARARGGMAMSKPSYVADQEINRLPDCWNAAKRNVVIFTSSEDERTAAGPQWRNPVYANQLAAVRQLKETLGAVNENVHITVRMHPRLREADNEHVHGLVALDCPRLTVLTPDSPVHSYALLGHADTVVTYGSTMGIEAVYWGKPSVTAGPARYQGLEATHRIHSHAELLQRLNQPLEAKPREPALIYGYYCATLGKPYRYAKFRTVHFGTFRGQEVDWGRFTHYAWALVHRVPPLNRVFNRRLQRRTLELLATAPPQRRQANTAEE
ncbi:MAG: hypothetical protein L0Y71_18125 [Gemmataceae bacterium]|nr:hypothetical protein [Gemmataceae bacterium]